jgi:hypothetical protein
MERFINPRLLGNPLNWITVALWLIVIGFIVHEFHEEKAEAN